MHLSPRLGLDFVLNIIGAGSPIRSIVRRFMRIAVIIFFGAGAAILGYLYPFVFVLRGRPLFRHVAIAWGLLVALVLSGFVLPPPEYRSQWSRDKTATIGWICLVWIFPLLSAVLALLVRSLLRRFWPRTLARIESYGNRCIDA